MAAIDPTLARDVVQPATSIGQQDYWTIGGGWKSWAFTLDHKRIGVMYLIGILIMFMAGGTFALLVRTELMTPGPTFANAEWYNRFFTYHGAIMVFIVIIPGIPAALGNFVMPIMLGAKDVAFPRLNLLSFYFWLTGTIFMVASMALNGVDTGWTFYTPYSTNKAADGVIPVVMGAFILGFSSILTGLNFIVTIHKLRRPEMSWFRMPLFVWSLYATALIQILATPVLAITLLLLLVERTIGIGFFRADLGGDPVLFQHFFWFYSHPAVYIMILPAMGVMSELVSTFSRRHIFGYRFIAFSSVAIAILGFFVWGHHMFVAQQSSILGTIFSAITFSIAIPSAIKVFNWMATIYGGSVSLKTPMIYALSFIWIFGIGGLTGLFLGTMAVDIHLHDTYFVVAHFHYVMAGTIFVFFGAVHYWWPKMTGKMYHELLGQIGAIVLFIGFNLTFFTQFILGSRGMPRRYYDYTVLAEFHPEFATLHAVSSIGSYITAIGLAITAYSLITSLFNGKKAPDNPWGGASLEWKTTSRPPLENFRETPFAGDPYDFDNLVYNPQTGGYEPRKGAANAKPAH